MIKIDKLSNGTTQKYILGIDELIIKKITNNEELSQDDLVIIRIDYFDGDEVIMNEEYLLLKETQYKMQFSDYYSIDINENGPSSDIEKLTITANYEIIHNYKYFNNIQGIITYFSTPFNYW